MGGDGEQGAAGGEVGMGGRVPGAKAPRFLVAGNARTEVRAYLRGKSKGKSKSNSKGNGNDNERNGNGNDRDSDSASQNDDRGC